MLFFDKLGMKIFDVLRVKVQGGSLRIYVQKKVGQYETQDSVNDLIKLEEEIGLYEQNTLKNFQVRIDFAKKKLQEITNKLKIENKTIVGYGAPTKATTLMSYFDIGKGIIDYIVDDNPLKQGKVLPLYHTPIYHPDRLLLCQQQDPNLELVTVDDQKESFQYLKEAYESCKREQDLMGSPTSQNSDVTSPRGISKRFIENGER